METVLVGNVIEGIDKRLESETDISNILDLLILKSKLMSVK